MIHLAFLILEIGFAAIGIGGYVTLTLLSIRANGALARRLDFLAHAVLIASFINFVGVLIADSIATSG